MDDSHRPTHSTSSSVSLSETLLDEQDEDVRIAVRALGDMRNSGNKSSMFSPPPLSIASSSSAPTPSIPSPTLTSSESAPLESPSEPDFVRRVSHIPLVHGALRMYEQSKASSRVVKYGAEIMESSVKTISRPVIERLPVNTVGQLDEFACRQLDRLQYRRPSSHSSPGPPPLSPSGHDGQRFPDHRFNIDDRYSPHEEEGQGGQRNVGERQRILKDSDDRRREEETKVGSWLDATSPHMSRASSSRRSPADSRSRSPTPIPNADVYPQPPAQKYYQSSSPGSRTRRGSYEGEVLRYSSEAVSDPAQQPEQQVMQKGRLQAVLSEFGGIAGALSEESMRKLHYCLGRLQDATNHIDAQILVLREFIASIQQQYFDSSLITPTPHRSAGTAKRSHSRSNSASEAISEAHQHRLTDIRRDVVHTVRDVVNVVSKYGGSAALPEPAKNAMKGFILTLPHKWAEAVKAGGSAAAVGGGGGGANLGGLSGAPSTSSAPAALGNSRRPPRRIGSERGVGSSSAAASPSSSRATSPSASPKVRPRHDYGETRSPTMSAGTAFVTAQRILALATESLDMMRGVTGVVKDSLDKADVWVERLRAVGMQRGDAEGVVYPRIAEGDLVSESSVRDERREEGRFTEYRGSGSPMMTGHGLRESVNHEEFSRSAPGSPYMSSSRSHSIMSVPVDTPSPNVGMGLRRMSIIGEGEENRGIKKEEVVDDLRVDMDVDG